MEQNRFIQRNKQTKKGPKKNYLRISVAVMGKFNVK